MDNWNHAKEEKKYMIMKKNKIALILLIMLLIALTPLKIIQPHNV